jgi:hypothetical protein
MDAAVKTQMPCLVQLRSVGSCYSCTIEFRPFLFFSKSVFLRFNALQNAASVSPRTPVLRSTCTLTDVSGNRCNDARCARCLPFKKRHLSQVVRTPGHKSYGCAKAPLRESATAITYRSASIPHEPQPNNRRIVDQQMMTRS